METTAYQAWLNAPNMPAELRDELALMTPEQISDAFYRALAFGTGGLRGVIGAGTNRMNIFTVTKATRGLARYLLEKYERPACAVSFDSRVHSHDFAMAAAAALAERGVRVFLFPTLEPTPILSFAVRHLACQAGVMITASHNPAKFNGYKVYGEDGCQITLEAAAQIEEAIGAEDTLPEALPDFERWRAAGRIESIGQETLDAYFDAVWGLRARAVKAPIRVVYSPLNGTGNLPVREIMRRLGVVNTLVVLEQELPDGRFPTCPYPNPEMPEAMALAMRLAVREGADYCLATDPDCDRVGVGERVGENVRLISGNDMGVLLLDYLCEAVCPTWQEKKPPVAVKTIVTTDMATPVCEKYGVELQNVLTGFKFIGESIGRLEAVGEEKRFLFGFEESYGYLSGTFVRDKDAVNASLLICEMMSYYKEKGQTLLGRLDELRLEHGFFAQRLLSYQFEGQSGDEKMAALMAALRAPLQTLPDARLKNARRVDYLLDDTGLPKSDVLVFYLADGGKLVVRPSGTEPKLKAYLFARADGEQIANGALDALEGMMNALCEQG